MSLEPAPERDPEAVPPEVEVVRSSANGGSVRVVLDIPIGTTVQITVEAAPDGSAPPVTVETVMPSQLPPPPLPLPPPAAVEQEAPPTTAVEPGGAESRAAATALAAAPAARLDVASQARAWRDRLVREARAAPLVTALFALALVIYAATRLWGIDQFPVFFYSDEANYVYFANELVAHGLRGSDGQFLPLYFEADTNRWAPLSDVYFQMVTSQLFGNSIFTARATNALISILCVVSVGLILGVIFKARFWWAAVLILGIVPAYFLYSRVVFEMIIMATFYAAFLLCYLLYRTRSPSYAYLTLIAGAATFYAYSAAQPMMLLAGALLLAFDFRYHRAHWRVWLRSLPLAAVLALPFVQFSLAHPQGLQGHLRAIFSYWVQDIPLTKKIGIFLQDYGYGLSPQFWFLPNAPEDPVLPNQRIPGQAHFGLVWLPFVAIGLWICLRHLRDARHRTLLLATVAVPMASALVSIEIRRMLAMLVPLGVFTGLGLEWLMNWLAARFKSLFTFQREAVAVFAVLAVANAWLLRDALVNGPTWSTDYGLFGVQYGVKQIFADTLPKYLRADPNLRVLVTPVFANNTQDFPRFFYSAQDQQRVSMGTIGDYLRVKHDLTDTIMVMDAQEYDSARTSPELKSLAVEETLYYPDSRPAFYVTRPVYVDNIDQVIAAQRAEREKPLQTQLPLGGQTVTVYYSALGSGDIRQVFDGDKGTLVRGLEANPFILGLTFPQPRAIRGADLTIGSLDDVTVKVVLTPPSGQPATFEKEYRGLPADPTISLDFPAAPPQVADIRFEIKNNLSGETAQIHVRELALR